MNDTLWGWMVAALIVGGLALLLFGAFGHGGV